MTRLATHLMLSTGHLDRDVADAMEKEHSWEQYVIVLPLEVGFWVRANATPGNDEAFAECMEAIPDSLADCLRYARSFGATWVLFDRDEPPIDSLAEYDW